MEVPLFLKVLEFPFDTVQDRLKEAPVPKTGSIHPSVSIKHRLVIDRHRAMAVVPPLA